MSDHYFSAEPASPDERTTLQVRLRGRDVTVQTAGGVFSGHRLDLGTQVLLRSVPAPPTTGNFLDLGCGWGPIALSLAFEAPKAQVWAVDVNARALELTRSNAESLGATGVRVCLPEQVPDDVSFDLIWSNPPVRIGKSALHALLLKWVPRLAPGGTAYLVVQRHLGADSLAAWLGSASGLDVVVTRAASAKGFRVFQVQLKPGA